MKYTLEKYQNANVLFADFLGSHPGFPKVASENFTGSNPLELHEFYRTISVIRKDSELTDSPAKSCL